MASAARTARPYYVVVSRLPGPSMLWRVEFGDYDRKVAVQECADMRDSEKRLPRAERAQFTTVAATCGRQTAVDAAVAELNAAGK